MNMVHKCGILADPSKHCLSVWLSTFQKCWLRSKYPEIYHNEQQKILSDLQSKSKKKKKKKPRALRKQSAIRKQIHNETENKKNAITVIHAGELDINIIEAKSLPQSFVATTPCTYCKFYVTNNDACFGETKIYSTNIQKDQSPKWDQHERIILTNTTGKLIVELWADKYIYAQDELIGKLEIELNHLVLDYCCNESEINDSNVINNWFAITLSQKQKNDSTENKDHSFDDIEKPIFNQIESAPIATNNETQCCIHLKLKLSLTSSFWSHFISHFDPVLPEPDRIAFNANLCYIEINKIYMLIYEVIIEGHTGTDIILWRKWVYSVIALFHIACFVYYPWFFFFYIELALLIAFCTSYATLTTFATPKWKDKTKEFNIPFILHWICIAFGGLPAMAINKNKNKKAAKMVQQKVDAQACEMDDFWEPSMPKIPTQQEQKREEIKNNNEEVDDESMDMPKFAKFCVKRVIAATDTTDKLWFHQEALVWINELLVYLKEIFEWKYVSISSMMVIILFILCILSIILHHTSFVKHQCFATLAILFCFYSKPIQFLLWLITGSLYYYYNYYQRYKQYKIEQEPIFIRAKAVNIESIKSLNNSQSDSNGKIYNFMKYILIPVLLLKDLIYGLIKFSLLKLFNNRKKEDECDMYDASKLCKISLIDFNSKYLCYESRNGNISFCDMKDCTAAQRRFISIPISSNKIGLKTCTYNDNRYLSCHSNCKIKIDKFKLFQCEIFEVIQQEDNCNKISLKCHHQKYLSSNVTGNIASIQKNILTQSEKFVVELINDNNGNELRMQDVLTADQLSIRNTYLFVANEKKKTTIIRQQIIRNLVNDKKCAFILAKLKSIKLLSF